MSPRRHVIGAEHVERAGRRGRRYIEVLPGSIVTDQARDAAARWNVSLRSGPLDRPAVARPDGAAALWRGLYRRSPKWMPSKPAEGRSPVRLGRIAIVGAGGVGASVAHLAAASDTADEIALVDIVPGLAASIALDLNHATGITRSRSRTEGGTDLALLAGSDVVVVTAGRARSPGMRRGDLEEANRRTVGSVAEAVRTAAPAAVVIVVSNPLDEMTAETLRVTGFPRERVLGMAGTLDSARFREALAGEAGVPVAEVEATVLGRHGEEMVPVVSGARIRGRPLGQFLTETQIAACVDRTISAGGQVVRLRRTGSASLAPAHATVEILAHMRGARAGPVPVSVRLEGEYGIGGVVLGVPCLLGPRGLIDVVEQALSDDEIERLARAAETVRTGTEASQGAGAMVPESAGGGRPGDGFASSDTALAGTDA